MRRPVVGALIGLFCLQTAFALAITGAELPFPPQHDLDDQRLLVPGTPALTMGDVNLVANAFELGHTVLLTEHEFEQLRAALSADCLGPHRPVVMRYLETLRSIFERPAAKGDGPGVGPRLLRDAVDQWRRETPRGQSGPLFDALVAAGIDNLAASEPPVSRRCALAFGEMVRFALTLRDQRVVPWDAANQDALVAQVIKSLPDLTPAGRQWLANADYHRHLLRRAWGTLDRTEREEVRRLIVATFAPDGLQSPETCDFRRIGLPPPTILPVPLELPKSIR